LLILSYKTTKKSNLKQERQRMRHLILASALVVLSNSALAGQCEVNFEGKLSLEKQILTITTEDQDIIKINQQHQVFVNQQELSLNTDQQRWAAEYYDGINSAAPQAAALAIEGINIATIAVTQVFGELLGADHKAVADLTDKLEDMSTELQYNFYAEDGSIRINADSFDEENFFGPQWEQEFERSVEELVMSSMGSIMVAVGTEMLFGGGDMNGFEQKMEGFAENIEKNVETKGLALEEKADKLCIQLASVSYAEDKLQESVPALSKLDVITVNNSDQAM
jgi:hypothetical protein